MLGDAEEFTGLGLGWCTECKKSNSKKQPFEAFDHS
jgi:hypothetical protein